jgi:hypothetical protein
MKWNSKKEERLNKFSSSLNYFFPKYKSPAGLGERDGEIKNSPAANM